MMLDKSQIAEWDGQPESKDKLPVRDASGEAHGAGLMNAVFDSREAVPTGEHVKLTPEQEKARRRRGQWLALGLIAFVILVFMLTMTKMGAQILVRDL